ncbi:TIGR03936 family radical SAM-associated protein [bacterium]|nr:TIGR03936 family radical SAM-associated protein [bacterium]
MNNKRIIFTKQGSLKYISHLDMTRMFSRGIRRSGLSVEFTKGYSPHYKIAFSNPLPLGVESLCEIADLSITQNNSCDFKKILNQNMPDGMAVLDVVDLIPSTPKLNDLNKTIIYESELPISEKNAQKQLDIILKEGKEVSVKKGDKIVEYNLKDFISDIKIVDVKKDNVTIRYILKSDLSGKSISTFTLIKGFMDYKNQEELSVKTMKMGYDIK